MTQHEYNEIQQRFSNKMFKNPKTNAQSQYNEAILVCKSIIKNIFEHQQGE